MIRTIIVPASDDMKNLHPRWKASVVREWLQSAVVQ